MNNTISVLSFNILFTTICFAQSVPVTGRVVDGNSPKAGFSIAVFTSDNGSNPLIDRGISDSDGRFRVFSSITDVENESISNVNINSVSVTYPNPSSGITNVQFSINKSAEINIKVFDILGQECLSQSYEVTSGSWKAGLNLKDFANGLYIVSIFAGDKFLGANKILIDRKFTGTNSGFTRLQKVNGTKSITGKNAIVRFIDSIIVSGPGYKSSTLRNIGFVQGDSVDVGDVEMSTGLANANVFVYDLFNWRDNINHPIVGATIHLGANSIVTDASGRGSFILPATNVPYDVKITHPDIRTRETKVIVDNDKSLEFDVMTMESYPDSIYNFMQANFGNNGGWDPPHPFLSARWLHRPDFVFNVDTTRPSPHPEIESWMQLVNFNLGKMDDYVVPFSENPVNPEGFLKDYEWSINTDSSTWIWTNFIFPNDTGKYYVEWYDSLRIKYGALALTGNVFNFETGEIYVAGTSYDSFKYWGFPVWLNIDRITVHELDTGIYRSWRLNNIQSVSNTGPPYEVRNYTPNDLPIRLYLLARPPGTIAPDKDNGWCQYSPESIRKPSNLMMSYTFTMEDGRTLSYQEKIDDLSQFKSITKMPIDKVKEMIEKAVEIK